VAARVFLGLSARLWMPYGIFCLVRPGFLEGASAAVA
jgi:hypothetical protein